MEEDSEPLAAFPGPDDPQALTVWASKAMCRVPVFRRLRDLDDALVPRLAAAMVAGGVRSVACAPQARTADWISPWRDSEMLLVCRGDLEILNAAEASKTLGCEKPGALINEVGALGCAVGSDSDDGAELETEEEAESSSSGDDHLSDEEAAAAARTRRVARAVPAVLAARGAGGSAGGGTADGGGGSGGLSSPGGQVSRRTIGGGFGSPGGQIGGRSLGGSVGPTTRRVGASHLRGSTRFDRNTLVLALPHSAVREALKACSEALREDLASYCREQRWLARAVVKLPAVAAAAAAAHGGSAAGGGIAGDGAPPGSKAGGAARSINSHFVTSFARLCGSGPMRYAVGDVVCRLGERSSCMFLMRSGRLDVFTRDGKKVAVLKKGACFGEIGVLTNAPRTATCVVTARWNKQVSEMRRKAAARRNSLGHNAMSAIAAAAAGTRTRGLANEEKNATDNCAQIYRIDREGLQELLGERGCRAEARAFRDVALGRLAADGARESSIVVLNSDEARTARRMHIRKHAIKTGQAAGQRMGAGALGRGTHGKGLSVGNGDEAGAERGSRTLPAWCRGHGQHADQIMERLRRRKRAAQSVAAERERVALVAQLAPSVAADASRMWSPSGGGHRALASMANEAEHAAHAAHAEAEHKKRMQSCQRSPGRSPHGFAGGRREMPLQPDGSTPALPGRMLGGRGFDQEQKRPATATGSEALRSMAAANIAALAIGGRSTGGSSGALGGGGGGALGSSGGGALGGGSGGGGGGGGGSYAGKRSGAARGMFADEPNGDDFNEMEANPVEVRKRQMRERRRWRRYMKEVRANEDELAGAGGDNKEDGGAQQSSRFAKKSGRLSAGHSMKSAETAARTLASQTARLLWDRMRRAFVVVLQSGGEPALRRKLRAAQRLSADRRHKATIARLAEPNVSHGSVVGGSLRLAGEDGATPGSRRHLSSPTSAAALDPKVARCKLVIVAAPDLVDTTTLVSRMLRTWGGGLVRCDAAALMLERIAVVEQGKEEVAMAARSGVSDAPGALERAEEIRRRTKQLMADALRAGELLESALVGVGREDIHRATDFSELLELDAVDGSGGLIGSQKTSDQAGAERWMEEHDYDHESEHSTEGAAAPRPRRARPAMVDSSESSSGEESEDIDALDDFLAEEKTPASAKAGSDDEKEEEEEEEEEEEDYGEEDFENDATAEPPEEKKGDEDDEEDAQIKAADRRKRRQQLERQRQTLTRCRLCDLDQLFRKAAAKEGKGTFCAEVIRVSQKAALDRVRTLHREAAKHPDDEDPDSSDGGEGARFTAAAAAADADLVDGSGLGACVVRCGSSEGLRLAALAAMWADAVDAHTVARAKQSAGESAGERVTAAMHLATSVAAEELRKSDQGADTLEGDGEYEETELENDAEIFAELSDDEETKLENDAEVFAELSDDSAEDDHVEEGVEEGEQESEHPAEKRKPSAPLPASAPAPAPAPAPATATQSRAAAPESSSERSADATDRLASVVAAALNAGAAAARQQDTARQHTNPKHCTPHHDLTFTQGEMARCAAAAGRASADVMLAAVPARTLVQMRRAAMLAARTGAAQDLRGWRRRRRLLRRVASVAAAAAGASVMSRHGTLGHVQEAAANAASAAAANAKFAHGDDTEAVAAAGKAAAGLAWTRPVFVFARPDSWADHARRLELVHYKEQGTPAAAARLQRARRHARSAAALAALRRRRRQEWHERAVRERWQGHERLVEAVRRGEQGGGGGGGGHELHPMRIDPRATAASAPQLFHTLRIPISAAQRASARGQQRCRMVCHTTAAKRAEVAAKAGDDDAASAPATGKKMAEGGVAGRRGSQNAETRALGPGPLAASSWAQVTAVESVLVGGGDLAEQAGQACAEEETEELAWGTALQVVARGLRQRDAAAREEAARGVGDGAREMARRRYDIAMALATADDQDGDGIAEDPHATEVHAPGRFACEHERRNCTFRPLRSEAATRAMRNPKLGYAFAKKGGGSLRSLPPRNVGRKDSLGAAYRNVVGGGGNTSAARADAVAAGFLARERSRAQAAAAARAAIEKRQDDIVEAAAAAPAIDACPRAAALVARLSGVAPGPVQPRMSGRGAAWDARIRKHAERGVDKAGTAANEAAELRIAHCVIVDAARHALAHSRRNIFGGDTSGTVLGHEVRLLDRAPFSHARAARSHFALQCCSSPCALHSPSPACAHLLLLRRRASSRVLRMT